MEDADHFAGGRATRCQCDIHLGRQGEPVGESRFPSFPSRFLDRQGQPCGSALRKLIIRSILLWIDPARDRT